MTSPLEPNKSSTNEARAESKSSTDMQPGIENRAQALSAPILVVGNVHSGTTLLQKILASHPDVYVGYGETQFYPHLSMIRSHFPDLGSRTIHQNYLLYLIKLITRNFNDAETAFTERRLDAVLDESGNSKIYKLAKVKAHGVSNYEQLYFLIFDIVTSCNGASRWLEKTPAHVFHIDSILQYRPTARIIEMVRDPRAVLASKRARSQEEWLENRENHRAVHATGGYDPVLHSFAWKSAYRQGIRAKNRYPDNILTIRYEDLVQHSKSSIDVVCDFVDMSFRQEMLQVQVTNSASHRPDKLSGISENAINQWRTQLPESAILICDWINGAEIGDGGYELYHVRYKRSYLVLPFVLSRSLWELCKIAWKRWRLRGTLYLFDLGRNYLRRARNVTGALSK
jgi:hypothetical protein